jgi:hypothetical protein
LYWHCDFASQYITTAGHDASGGHVEQVSPQVLPSQGLVVPEHESMPVLHVPFSHRAHGQAVLPSAHT